MLSDEWRSHIAAILRQYSIATTEVLKGLNLASYKLFTSYGVSPDKCYSTSNLAFKTFRTAFQTKPFGRLTNRTANIVRDAYYGGFTQVYRKLTPNPELPLFYADVNSMYPYQMLKKLPNIYMSSKTSFTSHDFGFVECIITVPHDTYAPCVPTRSIVGSVAYPTGTIHGIYFSEEVKHFINLGYGVEALKTYLFQPIEGLFDDYINTLYELKNTASDPIHRRTYKLLLNGLYGYLGRSQFDKIQLLATRTQTDLLISKLKQPSNFNIRELPGWIKDRSLMAKLIDEPLYTVEIEINPRDNISYPSMAYTKQGSPGNVAMSAAITSYARIMLTSLINNNKIDAFYADTDSLIYTGALPEHHLGKNLGLFKQELITGYAATNIKTYGYYNSKRDPIVKLAGYPGEYVADIKPEHIQHVVLGGRPIDVRYVKKMGHDESYNSGYRNISTKITDNSKAGDRIFLSPTVSKPRQIGIEETAAMLRRLEGRTRSKIELNKIELN